MLTPVFELFIAVPGAWVITAAVLGLMVGSFLNVVIHRLPIMMEREWREQVRELSGDSALQPGEQGEAPFNLVRPRSRCPHCGHRIRFRENIPVVSYLLLGGCCANCRARISVRYPLIELLTALLSAVAAWHFGFGWQAVTALLLTWSLIALAVIDIDHQLLPDAITLPLLWTGLLLSLFPVFATSRASIIGALAGYLSLWLVYHLFRLVTGKEGMGYGDFKLLAALGAWMGWSALPIVILFSSAVGAITGITLILVQGRDSRLPIPFGPYLAAAGWLTLLWGEQITAAYLHWSGLSAS